MHVRACVFVCVEQYPHKDDVSASALYCSCTLPHPKATTSGHFPLSTSSEAPLLFKGSTVFSVPLALCPEPDPGEDSCRTGTWLRTAEMDESTAQKQVEGKGCGFRRSAAQLDANEDLCACTDTIHLESSRPHNNYLLSESHLW